MSMGDDANKYKLVLSRHKQSLPTLGDNQKPFERLARLWAKLISSAKPQVHHL